MASRVGIAAGAIVLVCVLVLLVFPDPFVNWLIKPRITKAFVEAYPATSIHIGDMHYSVLLNRFGFDSIALSAADRTFSSTVGPFSVSGISWLHLLWGGKLGPADFANADLDVHNIDLSFPQSHYKLRCGRLRVSVPDSEMTAASINYHSTIDDKQFFANSRFRQTRFRFDVPQIKTTGLNCLELLRGKICAARSIDVHDPFVDILVNMDKPYETGSPNPQMPNEALSEMKEQIKIDSVRIGNGRLKYSETYVADAKPGVVTFDKMHVSIGSIATHTGRHDTTVIRGEGVFMNAGTMTLFMAIPLTSKDFSLRYSGSMSTMDVAALNPILELGQLRRIKSGILQSATYDVNVHSGCASGTLRVEYQDLSFAVLNKETGSEKGIFDRISSLFGRIFVVRRSNMPDKNGSIKIGEILYTRDPEDYFFQFLWIALRNGVADVVGFPKKTLPDHR